MSMCYLWGLECAFCGGLCSPSVENHMCYLQENNRLSVGSYVLSWGAFRELWVCVCQLRHGELQVRGPMGLMGGPLDEAVRRICGRFLKSVHDWYELLLLLLLLASPDCWDVLIPSMIWVRQDRSGPLRQCSTRLEKLATQPPPTFPCGRNHRLKGVSLGTDLRIGMTWVRWNILFTLFNASVFNFFADTGC